MFPSSISNNDVRNIVIITTNARGVTPPTEGSWTLGQTTWARNVFGVITNCWRERDGGDYASVGTGRDGGFATLGGLALAERNREKVCQL